MTEANGPSIQQIVEKVWLSIAERRLRPGVQLKEEQLAGIFAVSRARIRQALTVLERDGLVTIVPNRGAFVSKPSVEEARDVFFVRRTVERCIVERLCKSISKSDLKRLRDHVAKERVANANDITTDIIKLSGGFQDEMRKAVHEVSSPSDSGSGSTPSGEAPAGESAPAPASSSTTTDESSGS